ncbi:MAG: primosomal protein N' [Allomuricauda sp.]|nr:MAG: primosomal protein N' [Allomuricauda sp.]
MEYFLDVVLPIPLPRTFTYSISEAQAELLKPGMRVAVPFGKSKIQTALSFRVHNNAPQAYEAKEIYQILDDYPLVNEIQLKHWQWIADYYMCTLGEVFRSALPSAFLLESETLVVSNKEAEVREEELNDDEFLIYEALRHQSQLKIADISAIVGRKTVMPLVNKLLKKGIVYQKEELYEQYKPKLVRFVRLAPAYSSESATQNLLEQLSRAPKQREALMHLFQLQATTQKPVSVKALEQQSGTSSAVINSLISKTIFEEYYLQQDRQADNDTIVTGAKTLNEEQQNALASAQQGFNAKKVVLLHGVTASGKTEVYSKLIKDVLDSGQQVLYLLPEIALTTQIITKLKNQFAGKTSVYHSKYSLNERVEVWNNVLHQKEKAQIVVGARSSLFLPFSNLGLVVIDEEHESSFKQFDPAPRYHARDAAIVLANLSECACILGSATPSVESMYNANSKKYVLATMTKRYSQSPLPKIELVNLKEAVRKKQVKGHFSNELLNNIQETLAVGQQVILFQNRRGYAPIVQCATCGHAPQCPNCDVSLTFHSNQNQLRCHYCGYNRPLEASCEACGSFTLDKLGLGTEQVQNELTNHLPEIRTGRMDLDTTRGKHAHEKIITAFENREYDVLIGTQMVTKGLDFGNVGLVGIMNADTLLNFPDYRSHERSFQLLVQVAGRAGRADNPGRVIIQTYNPYHPILKQVCSYDYEQMYTDQIVDREHFGYPPQQRIIKITLKDKDFNKLNEASTWFYNGLKNLFPSQKILGPEHPPVARIRRYYLKNMLLKLEMNQSPSKIKNGIKRIQKSFDAIPYYKSVRLVYDVDHI